MPADSVVPAAAPAPRQPLRPYRVCLVCLGNICRSPTAAVVLRAELERAGLAGDVAVDSAGTGDWHVGAPMDAGARAELARRGYDGAGHRARQFQPSWFADCDLVLAMDRRNLANLRRMAPDAEARSRLALFRSFDPRAGGPGGDPHQGEVPDPFGGPPEEYALALDLLLPAARGVAARIAEVVGAQVRDAAADGDPPG